MGSIIWTPPLIFKYMGMIFFYCTKKGHAGNKCYLLFQKNWCTCSKRSLKSRNSWKLSKWKCSLIYKIVVWFNGCILRCLKIVEKLINYLDVSNALFENVSSVF